MITINDYKQFIGKSVNPPYEKPSIIKEIYQHEEYILASLENGWRGNIIILKYNGKFLCDIIEGKR